MKSRTIMTYAVALGLASTLALAGCTDGEADPTPTPTTSPSSNSATGTASASASPTTSGSSSASPTPSVNVSIPSAARANTQAGAIAFATWIAEASDYAFVNLDSSVLQGVSAPDCSDCAALVKAVADMKASGYRQQSNAITVDDSIVVPQEGPSRTVQLLVSKDNVKFVHTSGAEAPGTKAEKFKLNVKATWVRGAWQLNEVRRDV